VTAEVLNEIVTHPSDAAVLAPRLAPDGPWEPMLARYDANALADVVRAAIVRGERSFQGLFAGLNVEPLPLSDDVKHALRDWDTPEEVGT
jgi:molybdopterin-guanine dinucleotide biosynthesis protein A